MEKATTMRRNDFLERMYAIALAPGLAAAVPLQGEIAGVGIPDSAMAREAASTALACEPPEIFAHSLRTFLFAELIAKARATDHDTEAVYVASILHDTGLTAAYMSPHNRFEVDGANLARRLVARYGIGGVRAELIWDAIALHDDGGIARWKQPEVALVNAGVSTDFGAHLGLLARGDVVAVLKAAPRTGFIPVFLDALVSLVKRKPEVAATYFVTDVALRRVSGFTVGNFCDDVKSDPFEVY